MTQICTVCGAPQTNSRFSYGPIPLCDSYSLDQNQARTVPSFDIAVITCNDCGHAELVEKAPEKLIYLNYNYYSSNSPDLDEHFTEYASWIKSRLDLPSTAVHLDVGCNDGLLLEKTKAQGFQTIGIDPSPAAVIAAQKGFQVYRDFLSPEMVQKNDLFERADVITCNNMMANVRDLQSFGKCLQAMLKLGGYVIVETLHFPTLVRNAVFEMVNHEHFHYFTVQSIGRFFDRMGLELVLCERTTTKGGNMRCVARKVQSPRLSETGVAKVDPILADTENSLDLEKFLTILNTAKSSIQTAASKAKQSGPIAGFGAVGGTTILMYLLGLQHTVDFLVDDNPSRHGYFAPGSGIPVISPLEYHKRQPSLTIVFAWRFAAPIIARHHTQLPYQHKFLLANTGAVAT